MNGFKKNFPAYSLMGIGFIGIDLMGQHMARLLLEAGYQLVVWNRTKDKAQALLSAGAVWADSPKSLAQISDVVITKVTDLAASEAVSCGPDGILEGAHGGLIHIDMGSIAPEMSRLIAERARAWFAGIFLPGFQPATCTRI